MRLIHLSDLHLGKRVNEFSMLEDQSYILSQILNIVDAESAEAVLIAGDVYDKSVPPAEAVQLFDDFLCALARRRLQVFVISGNHDSPERIAFGARLMDLSGIHMSPVYNGEVVPAIVQDSHGAVYVYMLPFLKPAHVRRFFPEEAIESYTDAMAAAIAHMEPDPTARNVLVTHQFVTGALRSDSESVNVGGADNVDAAVFAPFDYVALGHIHAPQSIGQETVRYCGTPLKYSFSEAEQQKSVTVVEMGEKGEIAIRTVPLWPKHDLRTLRGSYSDLTLKRNYEGTAVEDYLHITLTDEEEIPDAAAKLRLIYPNLMKLSYDNARTRSAMEITGAEDAEQKTPLALFEELYEKQNNQPMSQTQRSFTAALIEKIWEVDA